MLRITNGKVYDPANGVDGVIKDLCIADGRIVEQVEGGRTIDATGACAACPSMQASSSQLPARPLGASIGLWSH